MLNKYQSIGGVCLLLASGLFAQDEWQISGDVRAGWVAYDYGNKPLSIDANGDIISQNPQNSQGHIDSRGFYLLPKISLTSPTYRSVSAKATVVGATDFGMNDEKYEKRTFVFDPNERKSFLLLQEAYIKYETKEHKLLIGREELSTPMIDRDDWYMLADTFELAYYKNNSFSDTTLYGGYFSKMAGVWDSGANGTEFHSMSDASFVAVEDKQRANGSGIYFAALEYNDAKHHALQIWNYYAVDLYNTLFMQYDYTNQYNLLSYDFGLQFMDFAGVGELGKHDTTTINYRLYSARFNGNFDNGVDFATGVAKYSDGAGQAATLGAFGGYPYFANGMIFHFFEAGSLRNAASYKAQVGYSFNLMGQKVWGGYRFTYFDLDSSYSFTAQNESQSKMLLNGLQLKFGEEKGAYFTGTYEHVRLDGEPNTYALRLIGGYRF